MLQHAGLGWLTAQTLIPAVAGLLGVAVGGWMQGHHQKKERENAFIKERLRDFYAPLLGMRSEIRAKSELRLKVSSITHAEWQAKFEGIADPEVKKAIDTQESPKYEKVFDYNDKQLREEIVPLYKRMLEWFSSHMWLAESSTLAHYPTLVEFVEIWNRVDTLPGAVATKLEHSEKKLYPLYDDLKSNFDNLSKKLRK
jgi:hypothetical protein